MSRPPAEGAVSLSFTNGFSQLGNVAGSHVSLVTRDATRAPGALYLQHGDHPTASRFASFYSERSGLMRGF